MVFSFAWLLSAHPFPLVLVIDVRDSTKMKLHLMGKGQLGIFPSSSGCKAGNMTGPL